MEARFKVRQDLAFWAGPPGSYAPGDVHVVNSTAEDMCAIEAAYRAGYLVEVEYDDEASEAVAEAVENDYDSLQKQAEAIESGEWLKGHLEQAALDAETGGLIEVGGDL